MAKLKVLLYEDMAEEGKAILREKAEVVFAENFDESYITERAKDVDGIVIRANGKTTRKIMESAFRLRVVGRHGIGVENIDLQAATDLGIWVVNTPDANDQSVAEHFFGFALMLSKMLKKGDIAYGRAVGKPATCTSAENSKARRWAFSGLVASVRPLATLLTKASG
jgi:D-3-phosphoglycerate dehydrogenase